MGVVGFRAAGRLLTSGTSVVVLRRSLRRPMLTEALCWLLVVGCCGLLRVGAGLAGEIGGRILRAAEGPPTAGIVVVCRRSLRRPMLVGLLRVWEPALPARLGVGFFGPRRALPQRALWLSVGGRSAGRCWLLVVGWLATGVGAGLAGEWGGSRFRRSSPRLLRAAFSIPFRRCRVAGRRPGRGIPRPASGSRRVPGYTVFRPPGSRDSAATTGLFPTGAGRRGGGRVRGASRRLRLSIASR